MGKHVVEVSTEDLKSVGIQVEPKMTEARREWVQAESTQRRDNRVQRLKFPIFDEAYLNGWVFRVERFFDMNMMTGNEKLEVAVLSMEGEAIAWF